MELETPEFNTISIIKLFDRSLLFVIKRPEANQISIKNTMINGMRYAYFIQD